MDWCSPYQIITYYPKFPKFGTQLGNLLAIVSAGQLARYRNLSIFFLLRVIEPEKNQYYTEDEKVTKQILPDNIQGDQTQPFNNQRFWR